MADALHPALSSLSLSDRDHSRRQNASPNRKRNPSQPETTTQQPPKTPANRGTAPTPRTNGARTEEDEARDAALTAELEGLRRINEVVEGVVRSLERAKENMDVCHIISSPRGFPVLEQL